MVADIFFYIFAAFLVMASLSVVLARNTVHAVLCLILCFVATSGIMLLMGAEFIGLMLVILYVGAVAVLFLFVVMMLNVNVIRTHLNKWWDITGSILLGVGLFAMLSMVAWAWQAPQTQQFRILQHPEKIVETSVAALRVSEETNASEGAETSLSNSAELGILLYTHYAYALQVAGLILLVAMIAAITLTLRRRQGVRRQDINKQLSTKPSDVLKTRRVQTGEGIHYHDAP